jgi:hypothetical protein
VSEVRVTYRLWCNGRAKPVHSSSVEFFNRLTELIRNHPKWDVVIEELGRS